MPSLLWVPEDEYNQWNAVRFKKQAEAMALPSLAKQQKTLYDQGVAQPPLPDEPPGNPPPAAPSPLGYTAAGDIPSEPPISATLPQPTFPAPPMPSAPGNEPIPGFLGSMGQNVNQFFQPGGPVPEPGQNTFGQQVDFMGLPKMGIGDVLNAGQGASEALDMSKRFGIPSPKDAISQVIPPAAQEAFGTASMVVPAFQGGQVAAAGRAMAPAVKQATELMAKDIVTMIPDLTTVLREQAKPQRGLNPSNLLRIRDRGVHLTDETNRLNDAYGRLLTAANEAAGLMATAITGKFNALGKPFEWAEGRLLNGPQAGRAMQDVMAYGSEDAWALLTPKQAEFVDYYHAAQNALVRAVEDMGVTIEKRILPEGDRYIHRIFVPVGETGKPIGPARPVGATQAHQMQRTRETVEETLNAGGYKTIDDPAALFAGYAAELLKRKADKDFFELARNLPGVQTVRERAGEFVFEQAVNAANIKRATEHLVRTVKQVAAGGSPAGASLRAIRQNFPQLGNALDDALQVGPPKFNQIIGSMGQDVWDALKVTRERFLEALGEARGMEGAPKQSLTHRLTEIPGEPTVTVDAGRKTEAAYKDLNQSIREMGKTPLTYGPQTAPITFGELDDALRNVAQDDEASLDFITTFYKEAFKEGRQQRGEAVKDVLIRAQDLLKVNGRNLEGAKRTMSQAIHEAKAMPGQEGRVFQPAFMHTPGTSTRTISGKRNQELGNLIFPEEMQLPKWGSPGEFETVNGADFARRLNETLGPRGAQPAEDFLAIIGKVNAAAKTGQVLLDMSAPLIQGLPLLLSGRVKQWGEAAGLSYASFFNPEVRTAWITKPDNFEAAKAFVEAGGRLGTTDFMEALEKGGLVEAARSGLSGAMGKVPVFAGIGERVHPGESFRAMSDIAKIIQYDALKEIAAKGKSTEVADFVSKMTGSRSIYGPMSNPALRSLSGLAAYAADYTRANLALAADVFKPGAEGDLARRAIVPMVAIYPAVVYTAAKAVDLWNGEDRFANPKNEDYVLNPDGRYFMKVPIGGDVISFASFWPGFMQAAARSTVAAVQGDPAQFLSTWQRWAGNRTGPLAGIVARQVQGRTFAGEPLDTMGKRAAELGKSPLPVTAQAALEGQGPAALGAQWFGLGGNKKSLPTQRDELLNKYAKEVAPGKTWDELALDQQRAIRDKHPDIIQAQDVARERMAFAGEGDWKTYAQFTTQIKQEREMTRSQVAAVTAEFKAGKMSGQEYRDRIQKLEFAMSRYPEQLQQTEERYKNMPAKPEDYPAFRQRMKITMPEKGAGESAVDNGIQGYYDVAQGYADERGFINDMPGFMKAREKFMSVLSPDVRKRVDNYVNANKDPELVTAQKTMADYSKIPRFLLNMPPDEEQAVSGALDRIRAREGQIPPMVRNRQAIALMQELQRAKTDQDRAAVTKAMIILKNPKLNNPQRRMFWAQHPLLQKYYSDVQLAD